MATMAGWSLVTPEPPAESRDRSREYELPHLAVLWVRQGWGSSSPLSTPCSPPSTTIPYPGDPHLELVHSQKPGMAWEGRGLKDHPVPPTPTIPGCSNPCPTQPGDSAGFKCKNQTGEHLLKQRQNLHVQSHPWARGGRTEEAPAPLPPHPS